MILILLEDAKEERDKAQSSAQTRKIPLNVIKNNALLVHLILWIPRIVQRGIDGARNNGGQGIPHFKLFAVNQNPNDSTCRWEQTKKVMRDYGHHTKYIPVGAIDLNGKGDPPSYP
ncbi:hypothetical protein BKK56_07105 [Rodentibacter genomosp. 2]|uniref:hypothetical protein n=1 Tax=Rodentibacter genomosp. 2 TaxID=1908266 RepID=UPI000984C625|nr:hypothetical protein BKK56_07105 [Rodentibacter genomosp. 2]